MDDLSLIKGNPLKFMGLLFGDQPVPAYSCAMCLTNMDDKQYLSKYIIHLNDHKKLSRSEIADEIDKLGKFPMIRTFAEAMTVMRAERNPDLIGYKQVGGYFDDMQVSGFGIKHDGYISGKQVQELNPCWDAKYGFDYPYIGFEQLLRDKFPLMDIRSHMQHSLGAVVLEFRSSSFAVLAPIVVDLITSFQENTLATSSYITVPAFKYNHAVAYSMVKSQDASSIGGFIEHSLVLAAKKHFGDLYHHFAKHILGAKMPSEQEMIKMLKSMMKPAHDYVVGSGA